MGALRAAIAQGDQRLHAVTGEGAGSSGRAAGEPALAQGSGRRGRGGTGRGRDPRARATRSAAVPLPGGLKGARARSFGRNLPGARVFQRACAARAPGPRPTRARRTARKPRRPWPGRRRTSSMWRRSPGGCLGRCGTRSGVWRRRRLSGSLATHLGGERYEPCRVGSDVVCIPEPVPRVVVLRRGCRDRRRRGALAPSWTPSKRERARRRFTDRAANQLHCNQIRGLDRTTLHLLCIHRSWVCPRASIPCRPQHSRRSSRIRLPATPRTPHRPALPLPPPRHRAQALTCRRHIQEPRGQNQRRAQPERLRTVQT